MRECTEMYVTEVEFEKVGWNFVRINVGLLRAKYSVLSSMKLEDFNSCETVSSSNTFLLGGFKLRPCHHGMARPQVADRGTASDKEGSCE